eukprot:TRINITY_DN5709_c0_g1_i1.p1 TRINITY_DN5709_c0_g1~~TRINITY_DN5709_c0_g1_i1.p1  ORF type:complete len:120 (-),score=10.84 TRINITY_DN5709_c0_g1_i1:111-470(-)
MCADLGLAVQNLHPLRLELFYRLVHVLHLNAHVMNAARGLLLDKVPDGRVLAQRLQQFQLGVVELNKHGGHAVLGEGLLTGHLCAEHVPVQRRRLLEVRHRYRHMVQPPQPKSGCRNAA